MTELHGKALRGPSSDELRGVVTELLATASSALKLLKDLTVEGLGDIDPLTAQFLTEALDGMETIVGALELAVWPEETLRCLQLVPRAS